jgi:aerobic-type carbon monoxide dehydrogenase small subunit (CoxS/CutS family)
MDGMPVSLTVNGTPRTIEADPDRTLLSVLREDLDLTGTKYGCGEGQCGACTVLVQGAATRSCLTTIGSVAGRSIVTIEGLESKGGLHPLQEAFLEADAMQFGYCTAGMIMAGAALLGQNPAPSEAEILQSLQGNVCRCGTYSRIVAAVRRVTKGSRG